MSICIKSPHQPCNVNRIWKGTATENFHIMFHTNPNHSPQVNFKSHCLRKGMQNCTTVPRKWVIILTITTVNAAADVLAVHRQAHCPVTAATHEYGQICTVRFNYSEQTTHGKSRTTQTGTACANCAYIFLSRVILEHYKMSIHRWIKYIFPFSTFTMYTSPMTKKHCSWEGQQNEMSCSIWSNEPFQQYSFKQSMVTILKQCTFLLKS